MAYLPTAQILFIFAQYPAAIKKAWADKLLEKLKPQTYPDIRAGRQCTFFLLKSSITWIYMGQNLKKKRGAIFYLICSASFSFFSTILEHNSHKTSKNQKIVLIEIFDCNLSHWIPLVKTINLISKFIKLKSVHK